MCNALLMRMSLKLSCVEQWYNFRRNCGKHQRVGVVLFERSGLLEWEFMVPGSQVIG